MLQKFEGLELKNYLIAHPINHPVCNVKKHDEYQGSKKSEQVHFSANSINIPAIIYND